MRGSLFMGDKYFFCLAQAGYGLLAQGHKAHLPYICSFYVKETSYTTSRREDNTFFPRSNFAQEI